MVNITNMPRQQSIYYPSARFFAIFRPAWPAATLYFHTSDTIQFVYAYTLHIQNLVAIYYYPILKLIHFFFFKIAARRGGQPGGQPGAPWRDPTETKLGMMKYTIFLYVLGLVCLVTGFYFCRFGVWTKKIINTQKVAHFELTVY